ncbi:MAG: DivIVA domain-containing protein [Balneolales bacterium]
MNLTALEIKQQQFEKSIRGYDINQVKNFLNLVSSEWEHLVGKTKDQENEIIRLKHKLKHYEKVEETLHETLQSAKTSADQRLTSAKMEADSRIKKADLEAERIISTAQSHRREIRMGIIKLLDRRDEMIRGMKSYLNMADESLEAFVRDEASIFKAPPLEDTLAPKALKDKEEEPAIQEDKVTGRQNDHKISEKANKKEDDQKLKYFSTDPENMDDLLDEID